MSSHQRGGPVGNLRFLEHANRDKPRANPLPEPPCPVPVGSPFHYAKHHNTEELRRIMGNSPSVMDRFYKGAISQVEVEKFWEIGPKQE